MALYTEKIVYPKNLNAGNIGAFLKEILELDDDDIKNRINTLEAKLVNMIKESEESKNKKKKNKKKKKDLCWTCNERTATHREWRDGLGEYEYTCPECHRNEYPEKYESEEEEEEDDE